jgi:AraC-like DNA-binding protein
VNMITTQGRHKVVGEEFKCRPLPDAEQEARIANAEREATERELRVRKIEYRYGFADGAAFAFLVVVMALLLSGSLT